MSEATPLPDYVTMIPPEERFEEKSDHEAGHYVILHSFGIKHVPCFMSILSSDDTDNGGVLSCLMDPLPAHQGIAMSLGGMAAQSEGICVRYGLPIEHESMKLHRRRVVRAGYHDLKTAEVTYGISIADLMGKPYHAVRAHIRTLWRAVSALSSQLRDRKILYHEEAKMILDGDLSQLEKYRELRVEADPMKYKADNFPEFHPGLPFYESAAETFARIKEEAKQ